MIFLAILFIFEIIFLYAVMIIGLYYLIKLIIEEIVD